MRLTVVICTWNRASSLRKTLDSMTHLVPPDGTDWELLVVDNNCTDDTGAVLESFSGRLPMRALREPRPGKSHALNRAVEAATGEYILYTDDDVKVDPYWLQGYHDAFKSHPDGVVFGGPIVPWFEGDPPDWLVQTFHRVEYAFAALDLGGDPVKLRGRHSPFGANMAIRAEEQRTFHYDTGLGPRPGSALRGEEVALVQRMFAAGAEGYWVPEARVQHHIPRERQTVSYLRAWYRGWGEVLALREHAQKPGPILGRPLWLWRELVATQVRYRTARWFAKPDRWIEELKRLSIAQGMFAALGRTD
jgi:glycosyltransferase involved in cell wall biosynthesis